MMSKESKNLRVCWMLAFNRFIVVGIAIRIPELCRSPDVIQLKKLSNDTSHLLKI